MQAQQSAGPALTGFTPINPKGKSDRQLFVAILGGLEGIHSCLDGFRSDQEVVNAEAATKRQEMAATLSTLTGSVSDLKTQQDVDGGRITKLAQLFGAEKVAPGEKRPKGHGIATWGGWKILGAVGGSVGLFVFLFQAFVAAWPAVFAYIMSLKP